MVKDGIPQLRVETSVSDNESIGENESNDDIESIGRGLKRKSTHPLPAHPSPQKLTKVAKKDPMVTVGHILQQGKKSFVIPQEVSQSTPQIFQKEGFVTIQKGTKKPKGKGFSKGNSGEETIIVHKSSRPKRNIKRPQKLDDMVTEFDSQCGDVRPNQAEEKSRKVSADPDFDPQAQTKRAKKGTPNIGRNTKSAKKMADRR